VAVSAADSSPSAAATKAAFVAGRAKTNIFPFADFPTF
jgi:hypothetical protein